MLIGEYIHTLDDKKRISLPVKFRKEMAKRITPTENNEIINPITSLEI